MSTRTTIWALFVGVLLTVLVVFFAVRGGFGPAVAAPAGRSAEKPAPAAVSVKADACWPMFHGGQGLRGRAPGELSDSLALLWKAKTGAEVKSSAALCDGRVFIGSSDQNIYAFDLRTGARLWSCRTGDTVEAAPCVVDGRVFVGSGDNFLYALDAGTGTLQWKYETGGQILGSANWTRSPEGQRTWILVGSYDNKLHCVDSESGQPVWTYETGNYVNGSPAVAEGKCVFGGCDARIHVVSVADGAKVTEIDSGSYIAASAAFVNGEVYVGNYGNTFLRADAGAGTIVWKYSQGEAPFFSSPAVGDEVVVFGGRDEQVHCVRRDNGRQVWVFKTLGEVNSSPVLCGAKVVVGSDDGRLYVLRLADGRPVWSYEIGQPIVSSPAVAGGLVVVGSDDGYVYAFGPKAAEEGSAQ
jgi:outer membrane protein assembly factor BamB